MTLPVTVVIPHFRAETLSACLENLYANSELPLRVIVVDDGQDAPSLRRARSAFPQAEVLRNEANLGFSASCNRGLEAATGDYAVLLNDDTPRRARLAGPPGAGRRGRPAPGGLPAQAALGHRARHLRLRRRRRRLYRPLGLYLLPRPPLRRHRERDEGQYDAPAPLFWACGSALFLRLAALEEIGRLDLDYFMHFEEIDLCWRLHLAGYRVRAVPQSVVYHHSGWSLPPKSYRKTYLNHRNNLVALIKNLALPRLLALLPARILLELVGPLAYLARGDWRLAAAPLAGLLWCLFHPLHLARRRRSSQRCRRVPDDRIKAGVYPGSVLLQYYARGVRRADALLPEEKPPS